MNQETFFQTFVENALEMALSFDAKGMIIYANHAAKEQLEYQEEIMEVNIKDLFPIEMASREEFCQTIRDQMVVAVSANAYRKNHTCFPVRARFYYDESGENLFFCMAIDETNVTYLEKQAQKADQEIQAASKVKTEFVANVTHELRTPVNGILANTQKLLAIETDESKIYTLKMMERGCKDMNGLINNILDFSKLEAGKFTLEKREFDFKAAMDYIKENHEKKITDKGLNFFITISNDVPPRIVGDELRIVQILNNLISNATKFTDFGKITVEVLKTAQIDQRVELYFIIMDTGIGIDKAGQDKLFKSFSQVDASISRKYGGTGLGLNISKQLVELMDGKIHVESEYQKGSVFSFHIWVELPKEAEPANESAPQLSQPDSNSQGEASMKNQTVLYMTPQPVENQTAQKAKTETPQQQSFSDDPQVRIWQYGTRENRREVDRISDKLILCVELENYEKAEGFADMLKKLLADAPQELRQSTLRLKMAVQKANYERISKAFESWKELYGR